MLTLFKIGDTFEGFSLSQIQDNNVVFTNGAARVELALDYFRKAEAGATGSGGHSGRRPHPSGHPATSPARATTRAAKLLSFGQRPVKTQSSRAGVPILMCGPRP